MATQTLSIKEQNIKTIISNILKEVEDWEPKYKRGCNRKNLKLWLEGDPENPQPFTKGFYDDNEEHIVNDISGVTAMDFFEWYDH